MLDKTEGMRGICLILAMAAATLLTRFLPFLLFSPDREAPKYVEYLGKTLPFATIGLLVVYCLKDVSLAGGTHGLPEAAAVAAVVVLHWWRGNTLLSIGVGTLLYMVLVQTVF